MDKKTRSLRAMEGQSVDRTPVYFYRHFFDMTEDERIAEYIRWGRASKVDMILIQTDAFLGFPLEKMDGSVNDLKGIKPVKKNDPYFAGQVERAKRISDELGDELAVLGLIYTPFTLLKQQYWNVWGGTERTLNEHWKENKQLIIDAMEVVEEYNAIMIDTLKAETNVAGLMLSMKHAEPNRFTAEEYIEYMRPWDERMIAHANKTFDHVMLHLCAYLSDANDLSLWKDYNYKSVNWAVHIEDVKLSQGREYFKAGSTLVAGFENRTHGILYTGTKGEVKNYTKDLIDTAGKDRYIICSDCSIDYHLPAERINWVVEACEEHAKEN